MDATTLQALINTLNRIQINGRDNMNMMLGCIMTLENELKKQQEAANAKNHPAEGRS